MFEQLQVPSDRDIHSSKNDWPIMVATGEANLTLEFGVCVSVVERRSEK